MTCNSPNARLVSHCSTTHTACMCRKGRLMTFTTHIKLYIGQPSNRLQEVRYCHVTLLAQLLYDYKTVILSRYAGLKINFLVRRQLATNPKILVARS